MYKCRLEVVASTPAHTKIHVRGGPEGQHPLKSRQPER